MDRVQVYLNSDVVLPGVLLETEGPSPFIKLDLSAIVGSEMVILIPHCNIMGIELCLDEERWSGLIQRVKFMQQRDCFGRLSPMGFIVAFRRDFYG